MAKNPEMGHDPLNCPSSNAEHWRSAVKGEQGPMAEDRAGTIDPETYHFCDLCDPNVPQNIKAKAINLQAKIAADSESDDLDSESFQLEGSKIKERHPTESSNGLENISDLLVEEEKLRQKNLNGPDDEKQWESFLTNLPSRSSTLTTTHDQKETLRQIRKSLTLSLNAIRKNPQELASQFAGRLLDSKNYGVQEFVGSFDKKVQHEWFCPRRACLPGPESPIVYSWPVFDDVPACRLIVSDNGKYAAAVSKDKRWIWEIDTGIEFSPAESDQPFLGIDWPLWRENLPENQFSDSGMKPWSAETPPSVIKVICSLEFPRTAFNRRYSNTISLTKNGETSNINKTSYSDVFASHGYLAPAISRSGDKLICGGLGGIISIWDLESGILESTMTIGDRTIVAVAGFPELTRCAVLTLDGHLLVVENFGNPERVNRYLAPPKNLFMSEDYAIAISTHLDSSVSVWCTDKGLSFLRKSKNAGPFTEFLLTPDLSFVVITGHGTDQYDGWFLTGINLTTGEDVFSLETAMSSEMFGTLSLELHENRKYVRIDPVDFDYSPTGASSSYSDVITWISLFSGEITKGKPPTPNGKLIGWANRDMYKVMAGEKKKERAKYVNLELPMKIRLRSERSIFLTPDLTFAIVRGLGADKYDGWLLIGFNLTEGVEIFSLETSIPSEMFGSISLELHDNQQYLRIDPVELSTTGSGGRSSYADEIIWISLDSGIKLTGKKPTPNGEKIEWAKREMYTESTGEYGSYSGPVDKKSNLEILSDIRLKSDRRSIQFHPADLSLAQFTVDEEIHFFGTSPYDDAVVFMTRTGLFTLDLIELG